MSVRCTAKSDLELAQEKIRELKREIRELKHSGSIVYENYILLLRDLGEYRAENKELRDALNTALGIEALDEENLKELIKRCRKIIKESN